MKSKTKFLIIGAGPTGLGAAYRLREHGETDYLLLDADSAVGGLAKSFKDEHGFTWDIGGHVQFSHYAYFDELMNSVMPPAEWYDHERESWVWIRDRFVPYPFQNNLRYLPKEELWKCLSALVELSREHNRKTPDNFREWILGTFGQGVADLFMLPYNFKVWATPPELMSYTWIGQRVAVTDVQRALGNVILGKDDLSWGPNNTFRFPRNGGTGEIWERVANAVGREHIRLSTRVKGVKPLAKRVVLEDGSEIAYDVLLNTMPLDLFVDSLEAFPAELKRLAKELVHSTTNVVGIGMEGRIPEHLNKKCWMYFPESNCPFYRATVFSHYSPQNVARPDSQWSLMLEISESAHKPVDQASLLEETRQGCVNAKLIRPDEKIVSLVKYRFPYGYPVPSINRDKILSRLHPALQAYDVYSRGRFGGWKYEVSNQDHSLMQGVEWADHVITGASEDTYHCKKGLAGKEKPLARPKKAA